MKVRRILWISLAIPALAGILFLLSMISTCERFPEMVLEVSTDTIEFMESSNQYRITGTLVSFGREPVSRHGFCSGVTSDPTVEGDTTNLGSIGTRGSFSGIFSDLERNTKYYFRAYAVTSKETVYGDEISITTPAFQLPEVTTVPVTGISSDSARSGGNITDDGGDSITARGVCWSTNPVPTISNNHTTDGSGPGAFTSNLTGLSPRTKYYVRAFATNSAGTGYGQEESFTTQLPSGSTVTDIDGNVYQIVQIGEQIWMAENLKVTRYADGGTIPYVESSSEWNSLREDDRGYCWYDNSTENRDMYGGLYTWAAAANENTGSDDNPSGLQGVCPDGWHLPSHSEWKELEMHLGMSQEEADDTGWRGTDEGGGLKEKGYDHWESPNLGATNESGFTALPSGRRGVFGSFADIGTDANFWTASEGNLSSFVWHRGLSSTEDAVASRDDNFKDCGYSIRCLMDLP